MSPTTKSLQRLMSSTPRSPRVSSRSLMTSTTMTSPSVRRSFMRAEDEPITLKKKACRPVCRRQSVMIERGNLLFAVTQVTSARETQRHNSENEQNRTLLERQREQILADCQAEIRKHEFQADYDRRSTQKLNENDRVAERRNFIVLIKETNDADKINNFFMNSYWSKTEIFVKLMKKVSMKWKNWRDFKVQHSTQLREENWSKIEILSLNSLARYRNCRMKSIAWTIQEISKMNYPTKSTCVFPTFLRSWRNAKPFCGNAEPQRQAAGYFGTRMLHRDTFL